MNSKGFTLIELIATIALLAIIAVISFVSINSVIKQSKVNDCENLVKNIEIATKEYFSDYRYKMDEVYDDSKDGNNYHIPLKILINEHYLSSVPKNPFTSESLNVEDNLVKVEVTSSYTLKNVFVCNEMGFVVDCSANQW